MCLSSCVDPLVGLINAQIDWETIVLTTPSYNLRQQYSHKFVNVLVSLELWFQNLSWNDAVVELLTWSRFLFNLTIFIAKTKKSLNGFLHFQRISDQNLVQSFMIQTFRPNCEMLISSLWLTRGSRISRRSPQ